jgi:hypothetical protein
MSPAAKPPSPQEPLGGGCLCGGVRFEVDGPFSSAGICHCTHCQRRTGTASSTSARVAEGSFRLLSGRELLESFQPTPESRPKVFCRRCGSHLFSGEPLSDAEVAIRLGVLDGDPGIRPEYRQWVDSAVSWEPIPDDGLPRHGGQLPG